MGGQFNEQGHGVDPPGLSKGEPMTDEKNEVAGSPRKQRVSDYMLECTLGVDGLHPPTIVISGTAIVPKYRRALLDLRDARTELAAANERAETAETLFKAWKRDGRMWEECYNALRAAVTHAIVQLPPTDETRRYLQTKLNDAAGGGAAKRKQDQICTAAGDDRPAPASTRLDNREMHVDFRGMPGEITPEAQSAIDEFADELERKETEEPCQSANDTTEPTTG
jgi:hypothetical protein